MIRGHTPTSPMVEELTSIWRRVLQRASIGAEDDFFDLGGDPASASALFLEISRVWGRELSPLTIYQARTPSALAAILERPELPRLAPIVRLRAGTEGSPVFFAHGLGGTVMEFSKLVSHIDSQRPIYGLQMKGIDGVEKPLDHIEDIAQYSLDAIRKVQPRGRYLLIGYSLGGLIALEIARRLSGNREDPALLVLVDSYPHFQYLTLRQQAGVLVRRLKRHAFAKLGSAASAGAGSLGHNGGVLDRPRYAESFARTMQVVRESANRAWIGYAPRFYAGEIKFVKAAVNTEFAEDPVAVWAKLAQHFEMETVPGDHFGILAGHVAQLAEALSRYLKEAPG